MPTLNHAAGDVHGDDPPKAHARTGADPRARFDYAEFVQRNIGFVSEAEQEQLRTRGIFVCGVGGMGGSCILSLARAGASNLAFADIDRFELSNLNRQVFAFTDNIGAEKVTEVRNRIWKINPDARLCTFGEEWVDQLDTILTDYPIVVNGMDDIPRGIQLYRKARLLGATVIDSYAAPLPSVTVVRPGDPRPEERLKFPTAHSDWHAIGGAVERECLLREIEYVLTHSSSRNHVDLDVAAEVLTGKRSRMAFAPMVITAGNLMCFEAINLALNRRTGTDYRGYFFNPWTARVEQPHGRIVAWFVGSLVRRFVDRMTHGG